MKIALVCDRWDHQGVGLELWVWDFVAQMGRRGHAMHVVTFDVRSPANGATLHALAAGCAQTRAETVSGVPRDRSRGLDQGGG